MADEIKNEELNEVAGGTGSVDVAAINVASGVASARTYTVQAGDNLTAIAAKFGTTWQAIYNNNRDIISDPNKIFPGQVLKIQW